MIEDYSIQSVKERFKKQGIYYTPSELAEYMKEFIDIDFKNVYDPTCGRGNLLSVFNDDVEKYGQELNEDELLVARDRLKNFTGVGGDTIEEPAFLDMKFDVIMANPPFSIKWRENKGDFRFTGAPCIPPPSKADYVFIFHCLHMLSDNGIAVIMNFPGVLYRGQREGKLRRYLIESNYVDKVVEIEGKKFTDTDVSTCLIILKKNKKTTDVTFINKDLAEKIVSFQEIKDNDFNLTISKYIEIEVVKEKIDPVKLEMQARESFFKELKRTIHQDFCAISVAQEIGEPLPFTVKSYVDEIKKTATKAYEEGRKVFNID